jgi:hypothetical protein
MQATLGKNAKPNERVFVECTADGMDDEGMVSFKEAVFGRTLLRV